MSHFFKFYLLPFFLSFHVLKCDVQGTVLHYLGLVAGPLATEPGAGLAGVVTQVRVEGEAGGGDDGEGGNHGHRHQDRRAVVDEPAPLPGGQAGDEPGGEEQRGGRYSMRVAEWWRVARWLKLVVAMVVLT